MSITQMAFREIWRRKLTFVLLAAAVALAAGTMIEQYRVRAEQIDRCIANVARAPNGSPNS